MKYFFVENELILKNQFFAKKFLHWINIFSKKKKICDNKKLNQFYL